MCAARCLMSDVSAASSPVLTVPPDRAAATREAGAAAPTRHGHIRFRDVLSALNPLQYLPVVGTIYRAVTGDTIPEPLQLAGSLLVSGLVSGPIGVLTNVATVIAEKVTGIDPDKIGRTVLAELGLGKGAPASGAPVAGAAAVAAPVSGGASPAGWTAAQLSGLGVTLGADGTAQLGALRGADALNELELGRLHVAAAAYARTAALAG